MKALYKLFAILFVFAGFNANAQVEPLEFEVLNPANIAGIYAHGNGFGATSIPGGIITADIVWAYDDNNDSLCCGTVSMDLTGKIALIRRGSCEFGAKALAAENAGAVAVIIANHTAGAGAMGMAAGAVGGQVTIPVISISFEDAAIIAGQIDMGNTVTASLQTPRMASAFGVYHAQIPQSQVFAMTDFRLNVFNRETFAETNVVSRVSITDPNNVVTVLYDTLGTLAANTGDTSFFLTSSYTPSALGVYTLEYGVSSDYGSFIGTTLTESFEVTDYTYSNDNGDVIGGQANPSWAADLRYDIGSFFFTGTTTSVAKYATFRLANPLDMHGATFDVILYDANIPAGAGSQQNYDNFPQVAFNQIVIDSAFTNSSDDDIVVELVSASGAATIDLNPNGLYFITVQHDGISQSNTLALSPSYVHTSPTGYRFVNTSVYTDRLYSGGWSSGINAYLRLHLDGYVTTPTSAEEVVTEMKAKINVFPNPSSEFVTVDLELENVSKALNVKIIDINGRIVADNNFSNVQNQKLTFDVSNYAEGNYFVRVQTDNGFETKRFVVVKSF